MSESLVPFVFPNVVHSESCARHGAHHATGGIPALPVAVVSMSDIRSMTEPLALVPGG